MMAPCRGVAVVFDPTEKTTSPAPVPECPEVIVIQEALLDAVHVTDGVPVVTVIDPVPPSPLMVKEGGSTLRFSARAPHVRTMAANNAVRRVLRNSFEPPGFVVTGYFLDARS